MFALEGFISVRSLYLSFLEEGHEKDTLGTGQYKYQGDYKLSERSQSIAEWNNFSESVTALLSFLDKSAAICINTTTGQTFKVDPSILLREPANSSVNYSGMWAIDQETWCVDLNRSKIWLASTEEIQESTRRNLNLRRKNGLDIDHQRRELNELWRARHTAQMLVDSFSTFQGSALCVHEKIAPTNATIANLKRTQGLFEPTSSVGRPSGREQVRLSYLKRFPSGHRSLTWKEVSAEIESECGIRPSVDTIKRAIGLRT